MKYSAMLLLAAMGSLTVQAQAESDPLQERPDKQAPLPSFLRYRIKPILLLDL